MARAGTNFASHVEMLHLGQRMRQQAELQFARQCQIALQALFLAGNLLVQARVFNGDRNCAASVVRCACDPR
jgi:hypothetical protein